MLYGINKFVFKIINAIENCHLKNIYEKKLGNCDHTPREFEF